MPQLMSRGGLPSNFRKAFGCEGSRSQAEGDAQMFTQSLGSFKQFPRLRVLGEKNLNYLLRGIAAAKGRKAEKLLARGGP